MNSSPPDHRSSGSGWNRRFFGCVLVVLSACSDREDGPAGSGGGPEGAVYVGRAACARCHPAEAAAWTGSHHDLALQPAEKGTVLGDFADAVFTHGGVTTTFSRRDGRFVVNTEGPEGKLADFEVRYVIGVTPLQQLLLDFPGGRLQALGVCWDARPREAGGQRWFHLHPGEEIRAGDELHWTAPSQNWNYMCASCHSTRLRRNYDAAADRYATMFEEIDVSCEACHGPGSRHAAWAERLGVAPGERGDARPPAEDAAIAALRGRPAAAWVLEPGAPSAKRHGPLPAPEQLDACFLCHSRSTPLAAEHRPGGPLLDTHRPALLEAGLYFDDGQIRDEVFEYGSFLQSRMHAEGVVCSDCHDPHSLRVRSTGNTLCYRCHRPEVFDVPGHHHHEAGKPGSFCVDCHMPARDFMVVDPRRDHSIRIPRPDLGARLGAPDACTGCHAGKSAEWAAGSIRAWAPAKAPKPHFGEVFAAFRRSEAGSIPRLGALARDPAAAPVVRATALAMLPPAAGGDGAAAVREAAAGSDPLVRFGAALALRSLAPRARLETGWSLLSDQVRAVRAEAAAALADVPDEALDPARRKALDAAVAEAAGIQAVNADRTFAHLNLGNLHLGRRRFAEAEASFRTALRLDRRNVPAWVNLADLLRATGDDVRARKTLEEALGAVPDSASVHHALGLALVRLELKAEALPPLRRAAELDPGDAGFALAWALALEDQGRPMDAESALEAAAARHAEHEDLLLALLSLKLKREDREGALRIARALAPLRPADQALTDLRRRLESGGR